MYSWLVAVIALVSLAWAGDASPSSSATLWLPLEFAVSPTIVATMSDVPGSKQYQIAVASMTGVYSLDVASTACAFRLTGEQVTLGSPFATYTCSELSASPSPTQTAWCNWQHLLPSEGASTLVQEQAMVTQSVSLAVLPIPTSSLPGSFVVDMAVSVKAPLYLSAALVVGSALLVYLCSV